MTPVCVCLYVCACARVFVYIGQVILSVLLILSGSFFFSLANLLDCCLLFAVIRCYSLLLAAPSIFLFSHSLYSLHLISIMNLTFFIKVNLGEQDRKTERKKHVQRQKSRMGWKKMVEIHKFDSCMIRLWSTQRMR